MKKMMLAIAAISMAAIAQAMFIDWKYTGTSAEAGYSMYLFANPIKGSYASVGDLVADSFSSGTVVAKKVGPKTNYVISDTTASSPDIDKSTANIFAVLIAGSDATEYKYGTIAANGLIYDPNNQESSSGTIAIAQNMLTETGTIVGTPGPIAPEPTSGLLLLVGMAGLALRRKQK